MKDALFNYEITVKRCGKIMDIVKIQAANALDAITSIESQFKVLRVQMPKMDSTINQNGPRMVEWTGFEFEARLQP